MNLASNEDGSTKSAILKGLVQSLSKMKLTTEHIERILRYLPNIGTPYSKYSQKLQERSKAEIDKEDALCVECFGKLVIDTLGTPYQQIVYRRIVPPLLHYFEAIPDLSSECFTNNESIDIFVNVLISQLSFIASYFDRKHKRQRDEIVTTILHFYEELQRRKHWTLIKPLLRALQSVTLPLNEQQAELFISDLLSVSSGTREDIEGDQLREELQMLALQVLSKLACLSLQVCPTEQRRWIIDCSTAVLESAIYEEVKFSNKEQIAAFAVTCIVQAGLHDPVLSKSVIEFVDNRFTIFTRVLPTLMSKGKSFKIDEYSSILQALLDIATQFPQKSSTIIDSIIFMLLKTLEYQPYYKEFTDATVEYLCHILKLQIPTENSGDVSLINGVITSLYTPFYLLHQKQMEREDYPSSPASRVSSVAEFSLFSRYEVPQEEETELINIIELIGGITLRLKDSRVTELVLPRLLRRVRYPPLEVDAMIISQLINICVLGQPSSYDVIVSEFLNVYKRFLKDDSNCNICDTTIPDALYRIATELPEGCTALLEDLSTRIQRLFIQLGKEVRERSFSSTLIQAQGYLLQPLAKTLSRIPKKSFNDKTESHQVTLLRTVWYYIVMFKFAEAGSWRADWLNAAKEIAQYVPVLTSRKVFVFIK